MRRFVALSILLAIAPTASAQIVVQSGFGFSFGGPRYRVTGFTGYSGAFVAGPAYWSPICRPWNYYAPAPVIVVVPQPIFVVPQYQLAGFAEAAPRPEPKVDPARWQVLRPNAPAFPAVPRPELAPVAPVAAIGERKPDAAGESARQVKMAREAFSAGEYGRAAERLAQAIRTKPDDPLPHFLLAQVRFARGEFIEAVSAIREGLKIAPDWPASQYSVRAIDADPAAFEAHMKELKLAFERHPDDVTVKYLLAFQHWFGGERIAAIALFRQLEPRVKDKAMLEPFLNVAVGRVIDR